MLLQIAFSPTSKPPKNLQNSAQGRQSHYIELEAKVVEGQKVWVKPLSLKAFGSKGYLEDHGTSSVRL